jgi:hypothetical protein
VMTGCHSAWTIGAEGSEAGAQGLRRGSYRVDEQRLAPKAPDEKAMWSRARGRLRSTASTRLPSHGRTTPRMRACSKPPPGTEAGQGTVAAMRRVSRPESGTVVPAIQRAGARTVCDGPMQPRMVIAREKAFCVHTESTLRPERWAPSDGMLLAGRSGE